MLDTGHSYFFKNTPILSGTDNFSDSFFGIILILSVGFVVLDNMTPVDGLLLVRPQNLSLNPGDISISDSGRSE
jgi:hypothetical protein